MNSLKIEDKTITQHEGCIILFKNAGLLLPLFGAAYGDEIAYKKQPS
ncbi:hypothetical protein [Paraglaciecola sp.]|nr:hypothetical protein [Paraglaciecola sp.]MDP5032100.1 hypothetical protein [Paraglaciecola sp.]